MKRELNFFFSPTHSLNRSSFEAFHFMSKTRAVFKVGLCLRSLYRLGLHNRLNYNMVFTHRTQLAQQFFPLCPRNISVLYPAMKMTPAKLSLTVSVLLSSLKSAAYDSNTQVCYISLWIGHPGSTRLGWPIHLNRYIHQRQSEVTTNWWDKSNAYWLGQRRQEHFLSSSPLVNFICLHSAVVSLKCWRHQ